MIPPQLSEECIVSKFKGKTYKDLIHAYITSKEELNICSNKHKLLINTIDTQQVLIRGGDK